MIEYVDHISNDKVVRLIMSRPLKTIDIIVLAILVIVAAILIYFIWPLIIAIVIIGAAYFIYKWYREGRILR